jgi:cation diffusion facilitator family transporter
VIAGMVGWFSLYISAKPRDIDHPYGHGKAEFLSAAIEGTLIAIAGLIIIFKSIEHFIYPEQLKKLDYGFLLIGITALINFVMGYRSIQKGKKNNSLALIASGRHLQTDTYSTLGIMVGVALIYFTGQTWIDSAVAILFAFFIIYTGYKIVRSSIAGIMDEADIDLLKQLVSLMNEHRRVNWIDLHNLRVIKYGGVLHIDCHLTLPWFLNLNEAHVEIDELTGLIRNEYGQAVEFFVHTDGCLEFSCSLCSKSDCPVRRRPFEKRVEWSLQNVLSNKKHQLT